jgi:hypothetical protein
MGAATHGCPNYSSYAIQIQITMPTNQKDTSSQPILTIHRAGYPSGKRGHQHTTQEQAQSHQMAKRAQPHTGISPSQSQQNKPNEEISTVLKHNAINPVVYLKLMGNSKPADSPKSKLFKPTEASLRTPPNRV